MKTNNLKQGLKEQHSNSLNVNISDLRMFVKEEITKQIKDLFEKLMIEERNIYLEENSDDIAIGFHKRNLLSSMSEFKI